MTLLDNISIRNELRSGDLGRVIALHGECYDMLPGFGLAFEAFVARTVAEYILDTGAKGRIWMAERGGRLVGCTAIVLRDVDRGQLRWVLVDQSARGLGLGCSWPHCRERRRLPARKHYQSKPWFVVADELQARRIDAGRNVANG